MSSLRGFLPDAFRRLSRGARRLLASSLVALALMPAVAVACPPQARPQPPLAADIRARAKIEGRPFSILAIGSSSTAGVGASRPEATFPAQLANRLVEAWGPGSVEVINAGVSAETSPATLRRLKAFMAAEPKPDLVVWQVGTNDASFFGTVEGLGRSVGEGLDAIKAAGAQALVIDQQYYPGILSLQRYEAFVAAVAAAASARGVPVLPRYAMMKQWAQEDPQGFAAVLSWDHFHMSDVGYACLADLLADAILATDAPAARAPSPEPKGMPANRPGSGAKKP